MKKRVTSLMMATLVTASAILPGYAAVADGSAAENAVDVGIYLDGEPLTSVESQAHNNVCYVTVESFVTALDPEAEVEQANGVVTVSAVALAQVVDEDTAGEETESSQDGQETTAVQVVGAALTGVASDAEESEEDAEAQESDKANVVEDTLNLSAGNGYYYVVANDRYLYVEDGNFLIDGKVAVPVRVMAEVFNLTVDYDSETKSVVLNHQEDADPYLTDGVNYYNSDTLYWLSRIIYAESGNQPLTGMIGVGNVVLNRVASPLFPNNIYDVLFQRNQFSPAASGSIYRTPSAICTIAAKLAMDGAVTVEGALFFNRAGLNTYASRNRPYVATIGGHAFYA